MTRLTLVPVYPSPVGYSTDTTSRTSGRPRCATFWGARRERPSCVSHPSASPIPSRQPPGAVADRWACSRGVRALPAGVSGHPPAGQYRPMFRKVQYVYIQVYADARAGPPTKGACGRLQPVVRFSRPPLWGPSSRGPTGISSTGSAENRQQCQPLVPMLLMPGEPLDGM